MDAVARRLLSDCSNVAASALGYVLLVSALALALKTQLATQSLGKFILTVQPPVASVVKGGKPTGSPVFIVPGEYRAVAVSAV